MSVRIAEVLLVSLFSAVALPIQADVTLVREGVAESVVVIPDRPTRVVRYVAEELVDHIEKASGVRLEILAESAVEPGLLPIYLGPCEATSKAGIDLKSLKPEAFVLQVTDAAVFLAGDDGGREALDPDTRAGTLWAVYEWLDRDLGVRWLWPGELGTHVPEAKTVMARSVRETIPQRFFQRRIRDGLGFASGHPALGFTEAGFRKFSGEQAVFLRRHRMGRSYPVTYGHAFVDWWETEGKAHPDWFQLNEKGKRGPTKPTARFSMCVSNPDLQREIVARWTARQPSQNTNPRFLNACENDLPGLCSCESCRALDGPEPPDFLTFYPANSKMAGARFVSDRYAHFWLGLQQLASRTHPDATVVGYAYFNYFNPPTTGIRLNPNILVGFCPSAGWFPRSVEEHTWMKEQWSGWHATGARLFLRTNHLLDGYAMPFLYTRQFADEFHHAVANGLAATDYDSLTGHWATQGPNLYLATRLHVRPGAGRDEILTEYYSAFGPAAEAVRRYFGQWEEETGAKRETLAATMAETGTSRWRNWAKAAHLVYPPGSFAAAGAILDEAAELAKDDTLAAARVRFLRLGLEHAKLCVAASAELSLARPDAGEGGNRQALADLIIFRRAHETEGISNFNHLAWVEELSWRLSDETKQAPELYP